MTPKELAEKTSAQALSVLTHALAEEVRLNHVLRAASEFDRPEALDAVRQSARRVDAAFRAWRASLEAVPRG